MTAWWVAWMLACRPAAPPAGWMTTGPRPPEVVIPAIVVEGPVHWTDGVTLDVPAGWSVERTGPGTLQLRDADTRAQLTLHRGQSLPIARPGWVLVHDDADSYRRVASFPAGRSQTWISRDPAGPTCVIWAATAGDPRVELTVASDRLFEAYERVQPILDGLSWPTSAGPTP